MHKHGCAFLVALLLVIQLFAESAWAAPRYRADFAATLEPNAGTARASITIGQDRALITHMVLRMPESRFADVRADGEFTRDGDRVTWQVPSHGGALHYTYAIGNQRDNGKWDAQLTTTGALFRGDDLFPSAVVTTNEYARSKSWLKITAPKGWSVETPYGNTAAAAVRFVNPQRRFDRPTGWMLAGPLGIRREKISGRAIAVAALRGEGLRRNDILAFLRWNLAELIDVVGRFPNRLLIVGADDPFWRGGLSGPKSLYMHSARPLIGEDGTSTLLHELFHVATGFSAGPGDDWIVEGIAEYYSMEVMRRTGTVSDKRFQLTLASLRERGADIPTLRTSRSSGAVTALAAALFAQLDRELRDEVDALSKLGLDAVVQKLMDRDPAELTFKDLADVVRELGLADSATLREIEQRCTPQGQTPS